MNKLKFEATKAALLARVREGEEYIKVAVEMDIPFSTAYQWVKDAGVWSGTPRPTPRTNPELAAKQRRFLTLLADGWPTSHASLEVGISETTARRWMRDNGITREIREKFKPPDPIPFDKLSDQAKRALEDPELFSTHYLGLDMAPWMGTTMRRLLELYESPEDEYANLNAHPGSGKSTILTFAFSAWVGVRERALGRQTTASLGHAAWTKATWYVKRLRTLFTHNELLIADFGRLRPESQLAPWSVEEILIEPLEWSSLREKEPTYSAASYDGAVLSGRYGLVIWDDLIDKKNSTTAEQRAKLEEWWSNDAEGRLNQGGLLVLSNARYGPVDLSHYVTRSFDIEQLDEEGNPRPLYVNISFKAHYEDKCNGETHTGPWPDGCLLNPASAGWKRLRHFEIQNEGRYRLVWLSEDTDPKGFLAQRSWFVGGKDSRGYVAPGCLDEGRHFGQKPDREDSPLVSAMTIDPSSSHYWALEHWLVYGDESQHLLRGMRSVLKTPELLYPDPAGGWTGIFEDWWQASLAVGVPFTYLIYEWNIQKALLEMPYFNEWVMARGVTHIPHTTTLNKSDPDTGVEMLGPLYQFGKVKLPNLGHEEQVFANQFIREACAWPEGQTDDLIMGHWFLNHRLPNLVVAELAQAGQGESLVEAPSWAKSRGAPSWAAERLGGGGSRDRDRIVVAR